MAVSWNQDKFIKALRFAAEKHKGQVFKGTQWSYTVHLNMVAMEIMTALAHEDDLDGDLAVQVALLHDVIEDTDIPYEEVLSEFGRDVADGVLALTKKKGLGKIEQSVENLKQIITRPREIWMVKLADRITNLQPPPDDWSSEKRKAYQEEAMVILEKLEDSSQYLSRRLEQKITEYERYIELLGGDAMRTDVTIEDNKFRIVLYHHKNDHGSRTIDATTYQNGGLTVGGYDLGPVVNGTRGTSDYEFDASVVAENKIHLYSALQKELFNNNEEYKTWLEGAGIVDPESDFNIALLLMVKKLGYHPHGFAAWARERDIEVRFWSYP